MTDLTRGDRRPGLPYVHPCRVQFYHTDPAGYVFFARFFEMFQAGIEGWFDHSLERPYAGILHELRQGLPTARTECDFLVPTKFGEVLDLAVVPERVGRSSITIRFEGRVGDELRLRARSVLVLIDLDNGRPVALDEDLKQRITAQITE